MKPVEAMKLVAGMGAVFAAAALIGLMIVDAKKAEQQHQLKLADERANKLLHDQRLIDEGCKKVDYVPTKHGVRAKWLCPDGSVALGAKEE